MNSKEVETQGTWRSAVRVFKEKKKQAEERQASRLTPHSNGLDCYGEESVYNAVGK